MVRSVAIPMRPRRSPCAAWRASATWSGCSASEPASQLGGGRRLRVAVVVDRDPAAMAGPRAVAGTCEPGAGAARAMGRSPAQGGVGRPAAGDIAWFFLAGDAGLD